MNISRRPVFKVHPKDKSDYLTTRQAAEILGRSKMHILALIEVGKLEAIDDSAGSVPRYLITKKSFAALENNFIK